MQEITSNEEDLRDSVDSNASPNFVASWASDNLTSKAIALRLDARFNPVSNNTQKLDIGLFINVGRRRRKVVECFCPIWL